ncbi:MAG: hypothetical protein WCB05_12450 [Candidatus Sulfotelmatobacter sp.]
MKTSHAELLPAAQARARASSSIRKFKKKVRSSLSDADDDACLAPISQRIAASVSRDSPIFSQPPLAWSSANKSFTIDGTADIGFVEVIE